MIQVTVIIPIHNSEKYLKECIESALHQSFRALEILCIESGSADRTKKIIEELQKKDDRIVLIQDPNTSYGHKINIGIERAKGKYVSILESDDEMKQDMIERLYCIAEKYDTDIVDADYCEMIKYKEKKLYSAVNKYLYSNNYNHLINYKDGIEREIVTNGIWTGLYKKSFIVDKEIRLYESEGASYQDLSFLFLTSFLAGKIYHINLPLYHYRVDNTESSVKDERKIFEIIGECEFLRKDLFKRGISDKKAWDLYYIRKYDAFYWNYCRLSGKAKKVFLEKYMEELVYDIETGKVERKIFDSFLYDRTFLLLDNKEKFIEKAEKNLMQPFLVRVCKSLERIEGHGVVLVGAGVRGAKLVDILIQNRNRVKGVCDNSIVNQGRILSGFKVISVIQAVRNFPEDIFLITSLKYSEQMEIQLIEEGISREKIIILE